MTTRLPHPEFFGSQQADYWNPHAAPHVYEGGLKRSIASVASSPWFVSPTLSHLLQPIPAGTVNTSELINPATSRPRRPVLPLDDPRELANRERFGLPGVVHQSLTHAGFDLTSLGLNLNSPGPINQRLISPFHADDDSLEKVNRSEATLPAVYSLRTQEVGGPTLPSEFRPKSEQVKSFPPETLFYSYFHLSADQMQLLAAEELYSRGWALHASSGLWMTTSPAGSKDWVFFDPKEWTTKPIAAHTNTLSTEPQAFLPKP